MNNFQKIKTIYEYLGWKYYGWNDSENKLSSSYFAPKNAKAHNPKINVHRSEKNDD
jgi:hypothetical protein